MARETGSQRRARTTRDPIAELKARIKRLKGNIGKTSRRGKSSQQNLIKTLETRLTKLQQNKNQFGNVYGNRKNANPIGRSVSKNKPKETQERIRDDDGNLKEGIWQTWDSESDKTTTHKGFPKKDRSNQLKVKDNKTKSVDSKSSESKENNKGSANKEKLKSTKMHSIERKNREIHGGAAVDRLKQKHKEWKKARKEGKLDEWKKKWKKKK